MILEILFEEFIIIFTMIYEKVIYLKALLFLLKIIAFLLLLFIVYQIMRVMLNHYYKTINSLRLFIYLTRK